MILDVQDIQKDQDEDGVNDKDDQCPGTIDGINVDLTGCALNQIDTDEDGISDATDQCANTPVNETVGLTGCSTSQVDTDSDVCMTGLIIAHIL